MSNMIISQMLDVMIQQYVKETISRDLESPLPIYNASDNIAEVIEKLVILHIRTWNLEDAIQAAKNDEEVADLKRKIDICFKVKRPKLVAALNSILNDAIVRRESLAEESVKLYKGIQ